MDLISKVQHLTDNQKGKIRELSQSDIPIQQRRALYNQMARRMKGPNLKPGLVEKYTSASSSRKERFQLLKEFLVDENMSRPQRTFQNGFNGLHWPLNYEQLIHDCFIEERGVR